MNYSALLDEISDEGSLIDAAAPKVIFLEHITNSEYRNVVVDLSEDESSRLLQKGWSCWNLYRNCCCASLI